MLTSFSVPFRSCPREIFCKWKSTLRRSGSTPAVVFDRVSASTNQRLPQKLHKFIYPVQVCEGFSSTQWKISLGSAPQKKMEKHRYTESSASHSIQNHFSIFLFQRPVIRCPSIAQPFLYLTTFEAGKHCTQGYSEGEAGGKLTPEPQSQRDFITP